MTIQALNMADEGYNTADELIHRLLFEATCMHSIRVHIDTIIRSIRRCLLRRIPMIYQSKSNVYDSYGPEPSYYYAIFNIKY